MKPNVTLNRGHGQTIRLQIAITLLSVALGAVSPFSTAGQGVISSSSTTGADLDSLFLPPTNSVTVDSGVTIDNTGGGSDAVFGSSTNWSLINAGTLNGNNNGVNFGSSGSVNNLTNGTISGGINGVLISGGAGSVDNAGSISGNTTGVFLNNGGSVNNQATGTISGDNASVQIFGGLGFVTNAGVISGEGVFMTAGGSVNNLAGGTISGFNFSGVQIDNAAGSVVNAGTITSANNDAVLLNGGGSVLNSGSITAANANYDGVNVTGDGSVTNLADGSISGGANGVQISGGTGNIVNAGSISGGSTDGVLLNNGGSVDNQLGGTIEGSFNGVEISGGGVVVNAGSITGDGFSGVLLSGGGGVSNLATGIISGNTQAGVEIDSTPGSVDNAGIITSAGNDGVWLSAGGSVNNQAGGTVGGYLNGVEISAPGSVANAGSISGATADGVFLAAGGSVSNMLGGTITGANNGLDVVGGFGFVDNAGLISGTNSSGVYFGDDGSLNNQSTGVIQGGQDGILSDGLNGSVVNAGTITGANSEGVYFTDSGSFGTVENQSGGVIQGQEDGVYLGGDGSVVNAGTITGMNGDGIYIEDYNDQDWVDNRAGGVIQGGQNGVDINFSGFVTNAGSISGAGSDGVFISGDATGSAVVNLNGGIISGNGYGVEISGDFAAIYNAGTITGSNGTAILLDNFSGNTVTLDTGSQVNGNIVGGGNDDAAFLLGHGEYDSNFVNFSTLTAQADATGWNLTGDNAFSTGATVESGLLRVNGTLTAPLTTVVDATGGLGGSGTINGIVDNHGFFAPGNSIGTLTINGSMTNGGNYYAEVDSAGNSDRIMVSDTATINGGDVIAMPAQQIYAANTVYTILTATNGVFGMYATSSIVMPQQVLFLASSLSNDLDNVYLVLQRKSFSSVTRTFNQSAVANALDGIVDSPKPGMTNLVSQFFWLPSAGAAQMALDSMSGEIHGTLGMLDVRQQDAFNGLVAQRTGRISVGGRSGAFATGWKPVQLASAGSTLPPMQQAEVDQPLDFWVQGIGTFGTLDGDGNAQGGDFTVGGLGGGLDYRFTPELLGGLGLGYSRDNADVGGPGANGTVDDYQVAGYGGYVQGPWHLDGILSYGILHTDTKRFINVGNIHQQADGSYDGGVLALSTEGGYAFEIDGATIEPTLGLNYAHLWQDSFSETGAAADGNNYGLNVNSVGMDSVRSSVGVRLGDQFGTPDSVQYMVELHALWEHEFADRYAVANESFIGGSGAFDVRGVELGADTARLGGGLTVALTRSVEGFVNYEAGLNSQINSSTVAGGLSVSW